MSNAEKGKQSVTQLNRVTLDDVGSTLNPSATAVPYRRPRRIASDRKASMRILNLLRAEGGATAIEYGLIAALISIACIIAFQTLGLNLIDVFTTISNALV